MFGTLSPMSDEHDLDGLRLRRAIRKEVAAVKRRAQARMIAHSPDEVRDKVVLRRQAWAALVREGRIELAAMEPEIDRLLRFDDRFTALLLRPRK